MADSCCPTRQPPFQPTTDPSFAPSLLQVLFLAGVTLTIGFQSTIKFFLRPKNYKGSGFFGGGVILVVWGWTIIGFCLEAYGFWLLFSAFFPTALSFLRKMPFLRQILDMPAFKTVGFEAVLHCAHIALLRLMCSCFCPSLQVVNKIAPAGGLPV